MVNTMHPIPYPSKYLTCYESVLMTLLQQQEVADEVALMGTQACFVLNPATVAITPKVYSVDEVWQRLYGYEVQTSAAANAADLRSQLTAHLDAGRPVCLPVDIFTLPHTLHYQQLHQHHYVTIFGRENGRYYMVCPYYRHQAWVDEALIHDGFFADVVATRGAYLIYLPPLTPPTLSAERVLTVIEENCHYMLNLAAPPASLDIDSKHIGLAGMATFAQQFSAIVDQTTADNLNKSTYVNLSRHFATMGHSRYWFQQLITQYQPHLLTPALNEQFVAVAQAWQAMGLRLGMGVHGERQGMLRQVAGRLQEIQVQETRLFNTLLEALPTYEGGIL